MKITTTTPATVIDVGTQLGPKSGTSWRRASSPPFPILGMEKRDGSDAITSYHSPVTNLRGLCVKTDEPICSLHIVLATESNGGGGWHHPDDGLPHCLEHLVFLGSKSYPHKGVLDKLANRCLADGTNAWTATDHTAYTLSTAGSEGAINLMPIFADHILFPTLTESGFLTEIHYVNGKGEDKGVVYCEMQGRENSAGSLVDRAVMELLYPDEFPCGYSAETGGKVAKIRALTVDKVRRYHDEYYSPDNVLLVLSGNVKREDFFGALDEIESLVLERRRLDMTTTTAEARGDRPIGEGRRIGRPWVRSPIPPMIADGRVGVYSPYIPGGVGDAAGATTTTSKSPLRRPLSITFPSEDESRGTVSIAWRGPTYSSRSTWMHISLLWDYLAESAASPLQLAFVENDDPICADLGPAHDVFTEGYHQLWFHEVDVDRMDEIVDLFYDVIAMQAGVAAATSDRAGFDLSRMRIVIRRCRRRLLEVSERRPTSAIIDGVVRNFLYGPRADEGKDGTVISLQEEMDTLHCDVNILPFLDEAMLEDATYWQNLMRQYILERPMAVVLGKPSALMSKEISDHEEKREAQQVKDLGEEALLRLQTILEEAMIKNEQPIPEGTLTSLPVPDIEKVSSIPLFTAHLSPSADALELTVVYDSVRDVCEVDYEEIIAELKNDSTLTSVPFHADLTHIDSAFVFAAVGIDTTLLSKEQRRYLPILFEILFKLPATLENGTQLSKEEFVNILHDETVSYSCGVGLLGGSIPQMCFVSVQVESSADRSGLGNALKWLRRALYLTNITTDSLKAAIQRLISDIPQHIRHGPSVAGAMAAELNYDPEKSNTLACNFLRQKPFLTKIYEGVENGNDSILQNVVKELEGVRTSLFQTSNMHAFVAANLRGVPKMLDALVTSLSRADGEKGVAVGRQIENVSASSVLRPQGVDPLGGNGALCALSAIESGFMNLSAPGIKPYDGNRASLLVAIEYLTALEGEFWVKLRGAGLTYSYSISDSTDSELLTFSLYKCTDIPAAFETASNIIIDYASGKGNVSAVGLENAKSSLAYQIISGRSSKLSSATSSFVGTFKGEKMDYDRYLLCCISKVTADDVMNALVSHLVPIFGPSSKLAVACPTSKLDHVHDYFEKKGWSNLKKVSEEDLFTAFVANDDA